MMPVKIRWRPGLILGLFCLLQWLWLSQVVTPAWDAAFYYSYARSVAFDGDLRIGNDLRLSYPTTSPAFAAKEVDQDLTENGRVLSVFAIGSSMLWVPWLVILRLASIFGQWTGVVADVVTGYEWYFTSSVAALSMFLGWLAYWLGYKTASMEAGRFSSLASAVILLFTTPLIYYLYIEPLYSHAASALTTVLVIFVWSRDHDKLPSKYRAIGLGALVGLATLVRWQHIIYLSLPIISSVWWWLKIPTESRKSSLKSLLVYLALLGVSTLIVLSVQLAHFQLLFGRLLTVPQGQGFMDWRAPFIFPVIFSTFRGLVPWMPVFVLAIIGLILKVRDRSRFVVPLLIVVVLSLYVNGSSRDWFAGAGYGPRRFTSELAIMIIGYAFLIQAVPERFRKPVAIIGGLVLALHQWILFRFGLSERIGGRNLSMAPTFDWIDETYGTFSGQLTDHLADIIRSPSEFFVWPNSPYHQISNSIWPFRHLVSLLLSSLFIFVIWFLSKRKWADYTDSKFANRIIILVGLAIIAGFNLWILFAA